MKEFERGQEKVRSREADAKRGQTIPLQQGANVGARFEVHDDQEHGSRDKHSQHTKSEEIGNQIDCRVAPGSYLLHGKSCKSRVGDYFQKRAECDDVAPLPVGLDAETAHQDWEGYRSDDESQDASGSYRGNESAIAQERARSFLIGGHHEIEVMATKGFLLKNGATPGRGLFEYCCPLLGNLIPIKVAGMRNRRHSERSPKSFIAQQTIQARSQIGIRAGKESGSAVDHVIGAVELHGNRRQAAGCGLQ